MRGAYARRKDRCVQLGQDVSKTAFWLGALNRLMRSAATAAVCAALGFVLGVGSTVITIRLHAAGTNRSESVNSLIDLIQRRQLIDSEIDERINAVRQSGLAGRDGVLVWDGKRFSVEGRARGKPSAGVNASKE